MGDWTRALKEDRQIRARKKHTHEEHENESGKGQKKGKRKGKKNNKKETGGECAI
jgi:hypothetical protein